MPGLIRRDGLVFDFGVNCGGFAERVAPLCRKVIGFEPDPSWRGRYHHLPANVTLIEKAVAAERGVLKLHVNPTQCSSLHHAEGGAVAAEVEAITLADALEMDTASRIDLIKMDIEGEELAVLQNAPAELFERIAQMTVEFHDFLDPESVPAIQRVIARMEGLGFVAFRISWRSYGDMLFVNRRLEPLSAWQTFYLGVWHKYSQGIWRMLSRRLNQA